MWILWIQHKLISVCLTSGYWNMVDEEVIKERGKNPKESQKRGEICVVSLKRSHVIEVDQEERCSLNIRLPPLLFPRLDFLLTLQSFKTMLG